MDELQYERLTTLTLPLGAKAAGRTVDSFVLGALEVRMVSLRRSNGKVVEVRDDTLLEGGDTLVLSGKAEALAMAEQKLLKT